MFAIVFFAFIGGLGAIEVCVSGHADNVRMLDCIHTEDTFGVRFEYVFQEDIVKALPRNCDDAWCLIRQRDDTEGDTFGRTCFLVIVFFFECFLILFGHLCCWLVGIFIV